MHEGEQARQGVGYVRLVLPDTVGLGVLLLSAPTPSVVHALLTLTPSLMLVFAQRLPLCFAFGGALMIVSQFEERMTFFFGHGQSSCTP